MTLKQRRQLLVAAADSAAKRKAIERFDYLLNAKTNENDWQKFFDENPFIFSDTLSIKFDGLYRKVPLVSGIPDYVFYRNSGGEINGDFGVIELKRPDQTIIGEYSSKIIAPSYHLRIAQQQSTVYLDAIQRCAFINRDDFFMAGNRRYAFIIIGSSNEISNKCHDEITLMQYYKFLPPGFYVYTYDELFRMLHSSLPSTVQVLFMSAAKEPPEELVREFTVLNKLGIHVRPSDLLARAANRFTSDISITKCGSVKEPYITTDANKAANAKSIMAVLMLEAVQGTRLSVRAKGIDAEAAMEQISSIFESAFEQAYKRRR